MSWLVDNANALYILGAIAAAAFVVAWRFNQRVKTLALALVPLAVMGLLFLLSRLFISDSKQLELNVSAMADAVMAGNVDELFTHVAKDFRYKGIDRDMMYAAVQKSIAAHEVKSVRISSFRVEKLSRAERAATASFLVKAEADSEILFRAETDFVLEGEQWKLKTMRFYRPIGGADEEIDLPGLR